MAVKRMLGFRPTSQWGVILAGWHQSLEVDRGGRSALRSCSAPLDVVFVPAYHRLFHELSEHGKTAIEEGKIDQNWISIERRLFERLPVIAGLVALVGRAPELGDHPGSQWSTTARQMGQTNPSEEHPPVSGLRFRRLLKCRDPEALYPALRRIIRLLRNEADICRLADDVFYWSEERRKRWAYDYYASAPTKTE